MQRYRASGEYATPDLIGGREALLTRAASGLGIKKKRARGMTPAPGRAPLELFGRRPDRAAPSLRSWRKCGEITRLLRAAASCEGKKRRAEVLGVLRDGRGLGGACWLAAVCEALALHHSSHLASDRRGGLAPSPSEASASAALASTSSDGVAAGRLGDCVYAPESLVGSSAIATRRPRRFTAGSASGPMSPRCPTSAAARLRPARAIEVARSTSSRRAKSRPAYHRLPAA